MIPESPRWLLAHGYNKEAYTTLHSLSNGKELPESYQRLLEISLQKVEERPKKIGFCTTIFEIVRSRKLLMYTIAMILNW